jgi:hypothetical protein
MENFCKITLIKILDVKNSINWKNCEKLLLNTVKPVLTTTSEQRPPVYNGQLEPLFYKTESNFIGTNCE